jgi:hypothetical protein
MSPPASRIQFNQSTPSSSLFKRQAGVRIASFDRRRKSLQRSGYLLPPHTLIQMPVADRIINTLFITLSTIAVWWFLRQIAKAVPTRPAPLFDQPFLQLFVDVAVDILLD